MTDPKSLRRRDGTEAEMKARSRWVCPGCGRRLVSADGLSWHLVAVGPGVEQAACPVAYREKKGLPRTKYLGLEAFEEAPA